MAHLETYTVECYSPAIDRGAVEGSAARAIEATAELRERGESIDYVGALLVPGDEAVFHLFRSASAAAVREASSLAGIAFERVLASILVGLAADAGRQPDTSFARGATDDEGRK